MELVPVPGSDIEMTLDHHLAFNVALECVVPSLEIELSLENELIVTFDLPRMHQSGINSMNTSWQ